MTKEQLRSKPFAPRQPHVVLLGAGASKAAMPNGDKNARAIPLMDDLPKILGNDWKELVDEAQPPSQGNFESTFSWIRKKTGFEGQLTLIESLIENYFAGLAIPEQPTIYDYLVLGLRGKDIIATFNWDPFLMQAVQRNRSVAELPDIRFLHGNVAFATCVEHDILGVPSETCPFCGKMLERGQLFFPDEDKDYTKDRFVQRDWEIVTARLREAFHLTIFGYSGPATDYKAKRLLLESWSGTPMREISHVEIIDIASDEFLRSRWAEFILYRHDIVVEDFWHSSIARWPRRTAEWKILASLYGIPAEYLGPLRTDSLSELQDWHGQIAAAEKDAETEADHFADSSSLP